MARIEISKCIIIEPVITAQSNDAFRLLPLVSMARSLAIVLVVLMARSLGAASLPSSIVSNVSLYIEEYSNVMFNCSTNQHVLAAWRTILRHDTSYRYAKHCRANLCMPFRQVLLYQCRGQGSIPQSNGT